MRRESYFAKSASRGVLIISQNDPEIVRRQALDANAHGFLEKSHSTRPDCGRQMCSVPRCPNEHRKSELRNGPQLIRRSQGSLNLIQSLGADFPRNRMCLLQERKNHACAAVLARGRGTRRERRIYYVFGNGRRATAVCPISRLVAGRPIRD